MMDTTTIKEAPTQGAVPVKTMQAVRITAPGVFEIAEVAMPQPKKGEVRIHLEGSGVCASNLPVWEGREWFSYPLASGSPGHEGWGVVDAIGPDVAGLRIGDRVAAISYNAYAEYDIAKAEDLVVLPSFLDNKPFPGEALGCVMNIFNRSDIQKGHTVAIVGCGFIGLLMVQLAKAAGANVIALSPRQSSLGAAARAGADKTIAMDDHFKIIETVKSLTNGLFCERVIEATGKEWPLNLSIELTAEKGKLIVAGYHQDGMRQVNMQLLNWRGIDMVNAHERDPKQYIRGMRAAILAIEKGDMNPFPLLTHSFSMAMADQALDFLKHRPEGFIKALLLNT